MQLQRLRRSLSASGYGYAVEGTSVGIAATWSQPSTRPVGEFIMRSRRTTLGSAYVAVGSERGFAVFIRASNWLTTSQNSAGLQLALNSGIGG
jgi:hypothetical protein